MSIFSQRIKQLRKQQNVTQTQVAQKLGITKQAYSLYENGKREPDFDTLKELAEFFGTDTDSLLYDSDNIPVSDQRLKFALFGDADVDDDVLSDVRHLAMLQLQLSRDKKKKD